MTTIFEVIVLLAALYQFAGIAARPAFRRETVWKPGWKWPLLGAAAGLGTLGFWAALRWPALRHAGAIALAALLLAAWWRARPSYGRMRRWPKGSLGIGHSLGILENQRYYLEQAARYGPVFKTSEFGRPVVCIVGLARTRGLLKEHAESFAGAKFTRRYHRFIPRGVLRYMDPSSHQEYAPRFRAAYGALNLERAEPVLTAIYRASLTRMAADSASTQEGIAAHPHLQRAVLEAVGYLFYGLEPGDPLLTELERCLPLLHGPAVGNRGWPRRTRDGLDGMAAVIRKVRPGAPGTALRAMTDAHPAALDDPTIIGNFSLISHIAYGDLTGLHAWIFKLVSDNPAALDAVRADEDGIRSTSSDLPDPAARIVMETLRLEQSEFLFRRVVRSFECEGMTIPAGWMVRFCIHESHRDPAVFSDPDRFDPERFAGRTYSRDEYAPFGADAHGCMGSHIAHSLGRLLVEEIARGFELRVVVDGPTETAGNRHRDHWRPSSLQRVMVVPRRV